MSEDDSGRRRQQDTPARNNTGGQRGPDRQGNQQQQRQNEPRRQQRQNQSKQQYGQSQQGPPPGQSQQGPPPGQSQQGPPPGQQQSGLSVDLSRLPWVTGALKGLSYFIATYVTLGIIFVADFFVSVGDTYEPNGDFFVYDVGWWIYNSFFVTVPDDFGFLESELVVPAIGYTVIAAIFLFLAGRSVARSQGTFETPNEQMALYGATVAVGYTLAAVAGAIILEEGGNSPDLVESILLIGIVFPVVFGGLGGYLAKR
jgi:hypothetical protein